MSELPAESEVPEWKMADRLRKALKHAGLSVGDMAKYLGVDRETPSRYINGRTRPDTRTLRLWAMRCGVPFEWLQSGSTAAQPTAAEVSIAMGAFLGRSNAALVATEDELALLRRAQQVLDALPARAAKKGEVFLEPSQREVALVASAPSAMDESDDNVKRARLGSNQRPTVYKVARSWASAA